MSVCVNSARKDKLAFCIYNIVTATGVDALSDRNNFSVLDSNISSEHF